MSQEFVQIPTRESKLELNRSALHTETAISTSLGFLVSNGLESVKRNPGGKDLEPGSSEDMLHALGVLVGFKGGKNAETSSSIVLRLGGNEKNPYPLPKVSYMEKNGEIVLGIIPADGSLPQGAVQAEISMVTGKAEGIYHISFSDAGGQPLEPVKISEQDLLLVFAMTHADSMVGGLNDKGAEICTTTFGALKGEAGMSMPDEDRLKEASRGLPKVQKFDSSSVLIKTIQDQEKAEQEKIRQDAEKQVAKKESKEVDDGQGGKKTEEVDRDPAAIESDIQAIINGKADAMTPEQKASTTAELARRLMENDIQDSADLSGAFRILYSTKIDEQIATLEAKVNAAMKNEADNARFANMAQDPALKANYEKLQTQAMETKQKIQEQLERMRNFRDNKDAIAEKFFRKTQACEIPREDVEKVQEAMAKGDVDSVITIMLESSGIKLDEEGIEKAFGKELKDVMLKLLEVGGPMLLYAILQLLMKEAQAHS